VLVAEKPNGGCGGDARWILVVVHSGGGGGGRRRHKVKGGGEWAWAREGRAGRNREIFYFWRPTYFRQPDGENRESREQFSAAHDFQRFFLQFLMGVNELPKIENNF
jgi:hypothetical protein